MNSSINNKLINLSTSDKEEMVKLMESFKDEISLELRASGKELKQEQLEKFEELVEKIRNL